MFINSASKLRNYVEPELFKKLRFIIIGDGPDRDSLREYAASSGIGGQILFMGWVKDMEAAYADIDIVALTSKNEGTPLSLIEAFAASKPAIATNVGGVGDVLTNTGILVEEDDEVTFTRRLSELVKSRSERKEMGDRGREYVVKKFSKENLIMRIEKLYGELLEEKGIRI